MLTNKSILKCGKVGVLLVALSGLFLASACSTVKGMIPGSSMPQTRVEDVVDIQKVSEEQMETIKEEEAIVPAEVGLDQRSEVLLSDVDYDSLVMDFDSAALSEEAQAGVKEANQYFERGNYRMAVRRYGELLSNFESEDKKLETALLTNMALSHLEDGNQVGFVRTAGRLVEASRGLKYLSRETQVVLKLIENMDGLLIMSTEDLRIERRISDLMSEIFEKGEQ